ncbi:hypothetical protein [Actimicrobium antarcticum]|uniref:Uncharacterized protein n=1 Tax=Actimicrobium antarcticum TaxID=1051899 RepID=A0ABP7STY4_9BURK
MKTKVASLVISSVLFCCGAQASDGLPANGGFLVKRMPLGSGTPAISTTGTEFAGPVGDGLYHVPNYLPGFPTAATIWPRALPLECENDPSGGELVCSGFEVIPAIGRGEYIFVRPVAKFIPPAPVLPAIPVTPAPPVIPMASKKPLG